MSVVIVILAVTLVGTLTWLGTFSPWSPVMDAWSAAPTPVDYVKGRTPLELQGALLVQSKQCRNCHSLGGVGGMRGPALDDTATRLTPDQIVRQIIQGGGNMPAYGKNLTPGGGQRDRRVPQPRCIRAASRPRATRHDPRCPHRVTKSTSP